MTGKPELTPLNSTALTGYHYDPDARKLTVEFTSGARHEYADVPMDKVEALSGNASPGSYFHKAIKTRFAGRRV